MFKIIKVCDVCEGMRIGWSMDIVDVVAVKKNKCFITLILSNGICRCYQEDRLIRNYV